MIASDAADSKIIWSATLCSSIFISILHCLTLNGVHHDMLWIECRYIGSRLYRIDIIAVNKCTCTSDYWLLLCLLVGFEQNELWEQTAQHTINSRNCICDKITKKQFIIPHFVDLLLREIWYGDNCIEICIYSTRWLNWLWIWLERNENVY